MDFLSKILVRNKPQEAGAYDASEKAGQLLSQQCYCGSLWWAAKALEASPSSRTAKAILEKALDGIMLIITLDPSANKKEEIISRLVTHRMTLAEAEEAADWTIKLFSHNLFLERSKSLLEHDKGSVLDEAQLRQARVLAAALIGEEGGQGCSHVQWISTQNPTVLKQVQSSIRRGRDALARMYRVNTEKEFLETCVDLASLYSSEHPEFAASLRQLPQEGLDMPFDEFRNKLERIFTQHAVDPMLLLAISRRPG